MKKSIRILVAGVLLMAIAVTAVIIYVVHIAGEEGSSALEKWIGSQLKAVAASHLNVEIDFESPDYQYPATIVVENIRLTAPDPAAKGSTIDIIRIRKATLTVGEIPSVGKPLQIERVILDQPEFSFVCTSAQDSTLIGFSNLVKTTDAVEPKPSADPALPPAKITDVFRIRLVHIMNGKMFYDPRSADKRAMNLDRINLALDVEPSTDPAEAGWYKINTKIDRAPISEITLNGRFNLNDNRFDLTRLSLALELGGDNNQSLPPQMQTALAEHDIRGKLEVACQGQIQFSDWMNANLKLEINLTDGHFTFGEMRLDVPRLAVLASMANKQVEIAQLDATTLDGTVRGNADVSLVQPYPSRIRLRGDNLRIEKVLKAHGEGDGAATTAALPFRGVLQVKVDARAPLTGLTTKMAGAGHLRLREGKLVDIPGLSQIEQAIAGDVSGALSEKKIAAPATDQADLEFTFLGDKMKVDRFDYHSTLIAVRATGDMKLQGLMLNLIANGGPIEKLQSLLGPIGDMTALLTDRVAKYQITGPISSPTVKTIIADGIFDKIFGGN